MSSTLPQSVSRSEIEGALEKARDYLAQVGATGWWPYKKDHDPSMEATAWAALALYTTDTKLMSGVLAFLAKSQNPDGGFPTTPGIALPSNWATGPALLAMRLILQKHPELASEELRSSLRKALEFLSDSRVEFFKPVARLLILVSKGEQALQYARGWPWDKTCFHWVEPTSYNLLALKVPGIPPGGYFDKVIGIANKFLLEHPCQNGGWNHGNNETLGSYLPPYRVTTAEALLALQDLPKSTAVKRGLDYLESLASQNSSSMSIAWSILALNAHGRESKQELAFLLERQKPNGSFGDNVMVDGLSTMALVATLGENPLKYRI